MKHVCYLHFSLPLLWLGYWLRKMKRTGTHRFPRRENVKSKVTMRTGARTRLNTLTSAPGKGMCVRLPRLPRLQMVPPACAGKRGHRDMRQGGGRSGEAEGKPGRLEQEQGKLRTNTEALAATPGTEPPSFTAPGADTGSGSKPSSLPSSKPTAAPPEEDRSFWSQWEGQGKAAWAGRTPGTFPWSRLFRPQLQGLPWLPVALRDRSQVLIRQQRLEASSLSLPACVAVASDPTTCPSASPQQR